MKECRVRFEWEKRWCFGAFRLIPSLLLCVLLLCVWSGDPSQVSLYLTRREFLCRNEVCLWKPVVGLTSSLMMRHLLSKLSVSLFLDASSSTFSSLPDFLFSISSIIFIFQDTNNDSNDFLWVESIRRQEMRRETQQKREKQMKMMEADDDDEDRRWGAVESLVPMGRFPFFAWSTHSSMELFWNDCDESSDKPGVKTRGEWNLSGTNEKRCRRRGLSG